MPKYVLYPKANVTAGLLQDHLKQEGVDGTVEEYDGKEAMPHFPGQILYVVAADDNGVPHGIVPEWLVRLERHVYSFEKVI